MQQSPWRAYLGQMHKNSSSQKKPNRHPIVVALTVISLIGFITAAFLLRLRSWYYGEISVLPLCFDKRYNLTRGAAILPINEPVAYSLSLAVPSLIVLCIELLYIIVSLDENDINDGEDGDESNPRLVKGLYLFLFRLLHFIAALILTAAFVSVLVDITKIVFNWPRPYFLSEFPRNCDPSYVLDNPRRTLSSEEINARLGFPSYRVALLSSSAVLFSVHCVGTLRAMRSSGPFQALIVLASVLPPLFAAASVLNSRENRPEDVVVSLLIGVISAAYMTSMLPTKLLWSESETESKAAPTTIEELNSLVQMRQAVAFNSPRSSSVLRRNPSINQRHAALTSSSQPVPLPGLTMPGGGLMRSN